MNKLDRFDDQLKAARLTIEQRKAVIEALDKYMDEYFAELRGDVGVARYGSEENCEA